MGEAYSCLFKIIIGLLALIVIITILFFMYVYGVHIDIHWGN